MERQPNFCPIFQTLNTQLKEHLYSKQLEDKRISSNIYASCLIRSLALKCGYKCEFVVEDYHRYNIHNLQIAIFQTNLFALKKTFTPL